MVPEQPSNSNRRDRTRRKVLKGGKIVFNNGQSVFNCSIRDLSEGGARLVVPDLTIMPHDFDLHLSDGRVLKCELRWAKSGVIGVKFREP